MSVEQRHIDDAAKATDLYKNANQPGPAAERWDRYYRSSHAQVIKALRSSLYLRNIRKALEEGGTHSAVFRQILLPPISQDSFEIVCKPWKKGLENNNRPAPSDAAQAASEAFYDRLDYSLAPWLKAGRNARATEMKMLVRVASTLMAVQKDATARRNGLRAAQEGEVIDLLILKGWTKQSIKHVDQMGQVGEKHFSHTSHLAISASAFKEVDVLCGLKKSRLLAIECKSTNSTINSKKRLNEVADKSSAWNKQYGRQVTTAAVLQGVISAAHVQELTDGGIEVFWSHNLDALSDWLDANS